MPNAQPSFARRSFVLTLSGVFLSLSAAAAASSIDSLSTLPTRALPSSSAFLSSPILRETIPFNTVEFQNRSDVWEEGTIEVQLNVYLSGENTLILKGSPDGEGGASSDVEFLRVSGDASSRLAVDLQASTSDEFAGAPPTLLRLDRNAFDDFGGRFSVHAGRCAAVVVSDLEVQEEVFPDFSQWDRINP